MANDAYWAGSETEDLPTIASTLRNHALTSLTPIYFRHPGDTDLDYGRVIGWMIDPAEAEVAAELLSKDIRNEVTW